MIDKDNKEPRDENGYPHGYWEAYWDNGKLYSKGNFIHGKRHGYCEIYFDNGELYSKGYYRIGKKLYQTSKNKLIL